MQAVVAGRGGDGVALSSFLALDFCYTFWPRAAQARLFIRRVRRTMAGSGTRSWVYTDHEGELRTWEYDVSKDEAWLRSGDQIFTLGHVTLDSERREYAENMLSFIRPGGRWLTVVRKQKAAVMVAGIPDEVLDDVGKRRELHALVAAANLGDDEWHLAVRAFLQKRERDASEALSGVPGPDSAGGGGADGDGGGDGGRVRG